MIISRRGRGGARKDNKLLGFILPGSVSRPPAALYPQMYSVTITTSGIFLRTGIKLLLESSFAEQRCFLYWYSKTSITILKATRYKCTTLCWCLLIINLFIMSIFLQKSTKKCIIIVDIDRNHNFAILQQQHTKNRISGNIRKSGKRTTDFRISTDLVRKCKQTIKTNSHVH